MNGSKKKVAICFFGHLRTYKRTADSLKKYLLNKYDCDLFMHTWSTLDHNTKTWHSLQKVQGLTDPEVIRNVYLLDGEDRVKDLVIEYQEDIKHNFNDKELVVQNGSSDTPKTIGLFGYSCLMYSMRKVVSLCENYMKESGSVYDYVLLVRPDFLLKDTLSLELVERSLPSGDKQKNFYTFVGESPKAISLSDDNFGVGGCDICFFARPEAIFHIIHNNASIIDEFSRLEKIDCCPELYLVKLVRDLGYSPYKINSNAGHENYWRVLRKLSLRKKLISINSSRCFIRVILFRELSFFKLALRLVLFKKFSIVFSIGDI